MAVYGQQPQGAADRPAGVDARTLWPGGVATALVVALVALVHLLLLSTPRALSFFGWIVGLATVVAGVAPFVTDADLASKLASALINVVIGFAILGLVSGIARSAVARAVRNG